MSMNTVTLPTKMGNFLISVRDHPSFPEINVVLEKSGQSFDIAIVEVDQFQPDDMSLCVKVFAEPGHYAPSHAATIYDDRLERLAAKNQSKGESK